MPTTLTTTEKTPSPSEWERAEQRAERKKRRCSYCGSELHTLKACDVLEKRSQLP